MFNGREKITQQIIDSYSDIEKGKKKHNVGDIVKMGPYWYIVIYDPKTGKQGYKYYSKNDPKLDKTTHPSPKTKAATTKSHVPKEDFPTQIGSHDTFGYKVIKHLGGSTGAVLVEHPNGTLCVRKRGANKQHIANEARSLKYYRQMGVLVPEIVDYNNVHGVLYTEYIKGKTLKDAINSLTPGPYLGENIENLKKEVRKGFAADVILGNRDVVGLDMDNVIIDPKGRAYRIDVGASLKYRAQGELKADWTGVPNEYKTMLNPDINLQTATIFGGITEDEIAAQLEQIEYADCVHGGVVSEVAERYQWLKKNYKFNPQVISAKPPSNQSTYTKCNKISLIFSSDELIPPKIKKQAKQLFDKIDDLMNITDDEFEWMKSNHSSFGEISGSPTSITNLDEFSNAYQFDNSGYKSFANNNKMSTLEAWAIFNYTTSAYGQYNDLISQSIDGIGKTDGNIKLTEEHISSYVPKNPREFFNSLSDTQKKRWLWVKLATRGIVKAINNKGSDVGMFSLKRNIDIDNVDKTFTHQTTICQCRFSSKSTKKDGVFTDKNTRIDICAIGLNIASISNINTEQEVLFHPFKPMFISSHHKSLVSDLTIVYAHEPATVAY